MIPDMLPIIEKEKEILNYEECFSSFNNDYLRANPITRKEGFIKYFSLLYEEKKISQIELNKIHILIDSKENLERFYKYRYAYDIIKFSFQNKCYHQLYINLMINSIIKNNTALEENIELNCGKIDLVKENKTALRSNVEENNGKLDNNYIINDIVCFTSPNDKIKKSENYELEKIINNNILEKNYKMYQSHELLNNNEKDCFGLNSYIEPSINKEYALYKNEKDNFKKTLNIHYITTQGCVKTLYYIRLENLQINLKKNNF